MGGFSEGMENASEWRPPEPGQKIEVNNYQQIAPVSFRSGTPEYETVIHVEHRPSKAEPYWHIRCRKDPREGDGVVIRMTHSFNLDGSIKRTNVHEE